MGASRSPQSENLFLKLLGFESKHILVWGKSEEFIFWSQSKKSSWVKNGHVEGPNLPFLTRHACGHCRQPTVWLCCCIGWYLTPFCTSTHVLCGQILKANGWMTCHCWLTIAHRYRSIWRGQLANYVASWHPGARTTREINQRGHADHIGKPRTCTAERAAGSVRRRPATVKPSD